MTPRPITRITPLNPADAAALERNGTLLLRGAVPHEWLEPLRNAFDANILPSDEWPVPRGHDWVHAQLDLTPIVQQVCRLPGLLASAAQIIGGPFFLSQVEGRAPRQNNATQILHRDVEGETAQYAIAFVYLDAYDATNGATQLVPGSHRDGAPPTSPTIMDGEAGDVIIMDARLLHGATTNHSGVPRRSLLICYTAIAFYDEPASTAAIRGVRMDTSEIFDV